MAGPRTRTGDPPPAKRRTAVALLDGAADGSRVPGLDANRVTSWLIVGADPHGDAQALKAAGVSDVLNCAAEIHEADGITAAGFGYFKVPWLDDFAPDEAPDPSAASEHAVIGYLTGLTFALESYARRGSALLLYVHCRAGKHRGPLMATALLALLAALGVQDAYERVRAARPIVDALEIPIYRQRLRQAVAALRPALLRGDARAALAAYLPLLADLGEHEQVRKGGALAHPIRHLDELLDFPLAQVPARPATGATEALDARYDAGDGGPDDELRGRLRESDRRRLFELIFAAMRATFLARWAETHRGEGAPRAALVRLQHEARAAADSIVRTHNRDVARFVTTFAARYRVERPDDAGLHDALLDALATWAAARADVKGRQVARYQTGLALSLAELYAADSGDQMTLDGPELTERSCPLCRAYYGRTVPARVAWGLSFPAHPNCEHTWVRA